MERFLLSSAAWATIFGPSYRETQLQQCTRQIKQSSRLLFEALEGWPNLEFADQHAAGELYRFIDALVVNNITKGQRCNMIHAGHLVEKVLRRFEAKCKAIADLVGESRHPTGHPQRVEAERLKNTIQECCTLFGRSVVRDHEALFAASAYQRDGEQLSRPQDDWVQVEGDEDDWVDLEGKEDDLAETPLHMRGGAGRSPRSKQKRNASHKKSQAPVSLGQDPTSNKSSKSSSHYSARASLFESEGYDADHGESSPSDRDNTRGKMRAGRQGQTSPAESKAQTDQIGRFLLSLRHDKDQIIDEMHNIRRILEQIGSVMNNINDGLNRNSLNRNDLPTHQKEGWEETFGLSQ